MEVLSNFFVVLLSITTKTKISVILQVTVGVALPSEFVAVATLVALTPVPAAKKAPEVAIETTLGLDAAFDDWIGIRGIARYAELWPHVPLSPDAELLLKVELSPDVESSTTLQIGSSLGCSTSDEFK